MTDSKYLRNRAHYLANKYPERLNISFDCEHAEKKDKHHPDYFKPYDVELLCRKCHGRYISALWGWREKNGLAHPPRKPKIQREPSVRMKLKVPIEMRDRIKVLALKERVRMSDLIVKYFCQHFGKEGQYEA
jgi:hypothetical protein